VADQHEDDRRYGNPRLPHLPRTVSHAGAKGEETALSEMEARARELSPDRKESRMKKWKEHGKERRNRAKRFEAKAKQGKKGKGTK
jgi:hypothetical protein